MENKIEDKPVIDAELSKKTLINPTDADKVVRNRDKISWFDLMLEEIENTNLILAHAFKEVFRQPISFNSDGTPKKNFYTGYVNVKYDDDAIYFTIEFNSDFDLAFRNAVKIINEYFNHVGINGNDYSFSKNTTESDKEDSNVYKFFTWCPGGTIEGTIESYIRVCDWLDKIKNLASYYFKYPDEFIKNRIKLNNSWCSSYVLDKETIMDDKKALQDWEEFIYKKSLAKEPNKKK